MKINNRPIGPGHPVYIVAELSANHNGSYAEAKELVYQAKEAGADAVKLQTFTPDTMTIDCDRPEFKLTPGPWAGRTLYGLYTEAAMPWDWQPKLKDYADELGIDLLSSPFDETAVDFLEGMGVPAYKIASFELTDWPLIEYVASKGKPMIVSTGMATAQEVESVWEILRCKNKVPTAFLKCTSEYPTPDEAANLLSIGYLDDAYFDCIIGLSDHTLGIEAPIAAVALGASIIEKHMWLGALRSKSGLDSAFSLDPTEFKQMVDAVRKTEAMLGNSFIGPTEAEMESRKLRRSLYVVKDIEQGEAFTRENVRSIRPANGLHPKELRSVLGRTAERDIERGEPLMWEMVK